MRKQQIAKRLAKRTGVSSAEAADQLDRVVHEILSRLRGGRTAPLPGLGTFLPGSKWEFQFNKKKGSRK